MNHKHVTNQDCGTLNRIDRLLSVVRVDRLLFFLSVVRSLAMSTEYEWGKGLTSINTTIQHHNYFH